MNPLQVRAQVLSCQRCTLRETCRAPVPWFGPAPNPIAVVGEAPGETEDARGIPFSGRAGRMLDNLWRQSGIARPTLLNVVSCRPPENRNPTVDERAACRANLLGQLEVIAPRYVLLLGEVALVAMKPAAKIAEWRGRPWWSSEAVPARHFLATYHPAYALRAPDAAKVVAADLNTFRGMTAGWWPEECDCGEPVAFYTTDGIPRCSETCQGRVCCKCKKPASWKVVVDGKKWLMCSRHKEELAVYRGVEVAVA